MNLNPSEAEVYAFLHHSNFKINHGVVDVASPVYFSCGELKELPFQFGKVYGGFYCGSNRLESLEGSPIKIYGNFACHSNRLTSFKYCPKLITGLIDCIDNPMITGLNDQVLNLNGIEYKFKDHDELTKFLRKAYRIGE